MATDVLIADDMPEIRVGLREILESSPDIRVVAEAQSGTEAITRIRQFEPDVALADVLSLTAEILQ